LLDCRDLIKPTVYFASIVPDSIAVVTTTASKINITTVPFLATISAAVDNSVFTVTPTQPTGTTAGKIEITVSTAAVSPQYGIVTVTVSDTGYAEWKTTVAVSF